MKKIISFLISMVVMFTMIPVKVSAQAQERASGEMRGAWISTVHNIDWPKTKNNAEKQKLEYINLIDILKSAGINTVIGQVRPKSDAFYKSNINPWSDFLTGTQGKDPGYDPLKFMIDEAHKRGMEFHAWFNPYRITTSGTDLNALISNHPARKNPSWVVTDGNALYYDPGNPAVRQYLVDTVNEVVRNYDIDGVHFDDYFYKGSFNDDATYKLYGNGMKKDDWRRNNVNLLIKDVHQNIKSIKPNIEFGISPFGIWKNKKNDSNGSNTNGKESYSSDYADSLTWIKNNWIDYIAPQLYWNIGHTAADYATLADWWSKQVEGSKVKLYIGQGIYKPEVASEITTQINLNRQYKNISGSMFFSARDILSNASLRQQLKNLYSEPIEEPSTVEHKQLIGINRYETSAKISREGWSNGSNTVVLVNGYANADGITATPLAAAYNAPILLTEKNKLDSNTKLELQRLNPSQVILIGGDGVIETAIESELKTMNNNIQISRFGGKNRYETSLSIAKHLEQLVSINKAYICYGYGEADALSIASKAGEEKTPIILAEKNIVAEETFQWLKNKNLETAYFIGGDGILYDSVMEQVNSVTTSNVLGNRVAGANRYETNAEVIKNFYQGESQETMIATKGAILADALTAGPLGAKLKAPVILLDTTLKENQKNVLKAKSSKQLYEIGGGINPSIIKEILKAIE